MVVGAVAVGTSAWRVPPPTCHAPAGGRHSCDTDACTAALRLLCPGKQVWLDTLAETRSVFLDLVQQTAIMLDVEALQHWAGAGEDPLDSAASPGTASTSGGTEVVLGDVAASTEVVWALNRVRRQLATVVLQWATALSEGTPAARAAPPASAVTDRPADSARHKHSRHASMEVLERLSAGADAAAEAAAAGPRSGWAPSAAAEGSQAVATGPAGRLPALGQQLAGSPPSWVPSRAQSPLQQQQEQQQRPPQGEGDKQRRQAQAGAAAACSSDSSTLAQLGRITSLSQQFIAAASSQPSQPLPISEAAYAAPSLLDSSSAGAASSPGGTRLETREVIPTGLVARYVALYDPSSGRAAGGSRRAGGGSMGQGGTGAGGGGASSGAPAGGGGVPQLPGTRLQRTHDWVQSSEPAPAAATEAAAGADRPAPGQGPQQQQQRHEQPDHHHHHHEHDHQQHQARHGGDDDDGAASSMGEEEGGQHLHQQHHQQDVARTFRHLSRPSFRIDLTHVDPELVTAVTPSRTSSAGACRCFRALVALLLVQLGCWCCLP